MVSGVTHNVGPYLRPKLVNVLADAGRFTNCGSLAMSAAMRRASSRVGKLAGQKQRALGGQLPRALWARSFARRVRNASQAKPEWFANC